MATTTNYSWSTPDDTALVKDGAAAIRTLGSSIDTTTKNLNPSTTLGDIEYRSSTANTNTRLGIGTTGQVLTVSGGVPAWATASSGGMTLLSTTTLSGTSTTISSISGSYNSLKILINNVNLSGNQYLRIRLNDEAGLANYVGTDSATGSLTTGSFDSAIIANNGQQILSGTTSTDFAFDINDYASSTDFKPWQLYGCYNGTDTTIYTSFIGGIFKSNTAISSIKFTTNGTVTFNGGTVRIYGVK